MSGIREYNCYYGTTSNPTTIGVISGSDCKMSSLTKDSRYYIKKCATSNSNVTVCSNVNSKITAGQSFYYGYNGQPQQLLIPCNGIYSIELWGAQGGGITLSQYNSVGGNGAYVKGESLLDRNIPIYLYVGGAGKDGDNVALPEFNELPILGGWNGGGNSNVDIRNCAGGGATDLRLVKGNWNDFNSLKSRIMVAAGGGGGATSLNGSSGVAAMSNKIPSLTISGTDGTQISGGKKGYGFTHDINSSDGSFGTGGQAGAYVCGGGGGGYYGGGGGNHITPTTSGSGGGGSSYVSGCNNCNSISENSTGNNIIHTGNNRHYSGLYFNNIVMKSGDIVTDSSINGYAVVKLLNITDERDL